MYIEKATIKNIKSIKDLEITFPKPAGWHVIIGDNGSGKSSILKAIALALIGPYEVGALRLNLGEYINDNEEKANVKIKVKKHIIDKHEGTKPISEPFWAGILIKKTGIFTTVYNLDKWENRFAKTYIWSSKRGWFSSSFGPFRRFSGGNKEWEKVYYSNPKTASHISVFGEDVALTESLEWLIQLNYQRLEGDEKAKELIQYLKMFINDGELLPHRARVVEINSQGVFLVDGYGAKVSVTEMSDGFRSILSMTFEIIRQMVLNLGINEVFKSVKNGINIIGIQGVILIDEIDAHLHPTWQTKIGN